MYPRGARAQAISTPTLGIPRIDSTGAADPAFLVPVGIDGATDFAVEVSDELGTWRTLWNRTHHEGTNVHMLPDAGPTVGRARFFRLRILGDSVEDRLAD